eukprot:NODE_534_length_6366_cov_0.490825.p4 type:complete len:122 gc:universal NODE_534_length_6366_cov_0.490825:347-712(+)
MRRLLRYFSDFLTSNHMSVSISKCGSFNSSTLKIQNSNTPLVDESRFTPFWIDSMNKALNLLGCAPFIQRYHQYRSRIASKISDFFDLPLDQNHHRNVLNGIIRTASDMENIDESRFTPFG